MANRGGDWCILRCAGRSTLPLAESLSHERFDVWTPSELQRYPGGSRARRPVPLMPTFIFAKASHLWTLVDKACQPFADFSVFRYLDGFPIIADEDLNGLRESEKRVIPKADRPAYAKGEHVRATAGPYEGLPGTVLRCKGGDALVLFGWQKVKISTFILGTQNPSCTLQPNTAYKSFAA